MACALLGRSGTSSTRSPRSTTWVPALVRRLGVTAWEPAEYPARLGRWPAAIGFVVVVWLELVLEAGPQVLFIFLVGYTALTLAMMAQFGRDAWRSQGEVFTVWFRLLGRLAPFALLDEDGRVHRRGVRERPAGTRLHDGRRRGHRPGRRLDPVRRPVADPDLVRPVRRAERAGQDGRDARVPGDRGRRPLSW